MCHSLEFDLVCVAVCGGFSNGKSEGRVQREDFEGSNGTMFVGRRD